MMFNKKPLVMVVSAAALASSQVMAADWALEEIVVTAQKRAQNLNDVGISVNAFSGDQMKDLGLNDTASIAANTPGFQVTDAAGTGIPVYTIRGIGFDDFSVNSSSAVGVYVDEVAKPYPVMTAGLQFDMERIEVLKGPQGDLYGRNSTAGAINMVNNKPTEETGANISVDYGNYSYVKTEGFVNGALTDSLNARVSFTTTNRDEWQTNEIDGSKNGELDSHAVRAQFDIQASDDVSILTMFHYGKDKSQPQVAQSTLVTPASQYYAQLYNAYYASYLSYYGLNTYTPNGLEDFLVQNPNDAAAARWNTQPSMNAKTQGAAVTVNWDMESMSLTSITAYDKFERTYDNDLDGMDTTNLHVHSNDEIESISQEIRLTSADDGDLTWVSGVYFSKDEVNLNSYLPIEEATAALPTFGGFDTGSRGKQDTETRGVFAHAEFQATDMLKLTGGVRYTWEERSIDTCTYDPDGRTTGTFYPVIEYIFPLINTNGATLPGQGDCINIAADPANPGTTPPSVIFPGLYSDKIVTEKITGKVGVDFTPNDDWLIYTSVGTGFKSGGFNSFAALTVDQLKPYQEEEVLAYEIGFKGSLLENTMQLNGAVFKYDYRDKQVSDLAADPVGVFPALTFLQNVDKSEVDGAELELQWLPFEGFSLRSAATYLDAKVTSDPDGGFDGVTSAQVNTVGNKLPNSPRWSYSVLASYEFMVSDGLNLRTSVDYSHQTESYAFLANDVEGHGAFKLDGYGVVNARITLFADDDTWSASLWGKNLDNESYYFSRAFAQDGTVGFKGMKPTYGVNFSYNFQ